MQSDMMQRLRAALPQVRSWIEDYIEANSSRARPVSSYGWTRLPTYYPADLLDRAKVVTVEKTPFPPVDRFGLPEFADHQNQSFDGITFKDTFFVREEHQSESLHFHDLVHVVQWSRLGPDNFLLAYAVGLAQLGYENSPLEQMAFGFQAQFDRGTLPSKSLVSLIEQSTDHVWSHAQQFL